jgi:hypothetical protein
MMFVLIALALVAPLPAAAAARPLAERLPPRTAVWVLAGGAVALAVTSCAGLGLLVLAAALRLPLVAGLGGLAPGLVRRDDPATLPLGVLAGAVLAVAAAAAIRAGWRRGRAIAGARRQARRLPGTAQLAVVPVREADAYTVPGWPGRIVVTSGLLGALAPAEREVLLAHERAHAAGHHFLFMAAARLAAAANPLLAPLAAAVGYSAERWADEHAATVTGDRRLAARTVAKAALVTAAAPARRPAAEAELCAVPRPGGDRRTGGPVPRRVAALLRPAPRPRRLLAVLAGGLVAAAGLAALAAAVDVHALIELAQSARW